MTKTVLLLGVRADLLETVKQQLQTPGTEFLGGTGVADVEPALLGGLGGYEPRESPNAILRAERPGSDAG